MTEKEFEKALLSVLVDGEQPEDVGIEVSEGDTYSELGYMTKNKGLVICLKDGSEFHITIVKA